MGNEATNAGAAHFTAPLALIPKAERIGLPDADHSMLARKPQEVAAAIADFVERHPM